MSELEFYRAEYQKWIKENESKGVMLAKENELIIFDNQGVILFERKKK